MDAITLLKNDHKAVEDLFRKFEKAGENAHKTKQKLVERIVQELSVHAAVEEMTFYPFVKGVNEELTNNVLESLEEHHVVKWLVSELDGMSPNAERFDAKVTVLMENVRHHVEEEEREHVPARVCRRTLTCAARRTRRADRAGEEDGTDAAAPQGTYEPPANVLTGLVSGFIDRVRTTATTATRTAATQDLHHGADVRRALARARLANGRLRSALLGRRPRLVAG